MANEYMKRLWMIGVVNLSRIINFGLCKLIVPQYGFGSIIAVQRNNVQLVLCIVSAKLL